MKNPRASRKTPQQRRSQATVETILDAAAQVFCRQGFAAANTNAIAAQAGVSVGSLYQYFPDKSALLEALRERHIKGLWAAIGAACDEACALPWPAALRAVIARCSDYNAPHVRLIALVHQELPVHPPRLDRMALAQATLHEQLRQLLEAHRASLKISVDRALFILPALGRGLFTAAAVEQPQSIEQGALVDDVVAAMLGCLSRV